jgi:hypothetical protein
MERLRRQAVNYLLMAVDKDECEKINIKFVNSRRHIIDNAIRFMDFYEPGIKNESPFVRSNIISEIYNVVDMFFESQNHE